jgi:hypothetical protein
MEGGKSSRHGVPRGGVISPLIANLYMNRFLKYWRQTRRGEAWKAHIINYADLGVSVSLADSNETPGRLRDPQSRTRGRGAGVDGHADVRLRHIPSSSLPDAAASGCGGGDRR